MKAENIKEQYPAGCRIILRHMGDDPRPVPDNTKGTVDHVDDIGTIHVRFDNDRCLGLIVGEDDFARID